MLNSVPQKGNAQSKKDSLLHKLAAVGDDTNKVKLLNELSRFLNNENNHDSAIVLAQQAKSLAERLHYPYGVALSYQRLAIILAYLHQDSIAMKYYNNALILFEKTGDKKKMGNCYDDIGRIYAVMGSYAVALQYEFKALHLYEAVQASWDAALVYNTLSEIYRLYYDQGYDKKNVRAKALKYANAAMTIFQQLGDKKNIANAYACIANVYDADKNYKLALNYFLKALTLTQQLNDTSDLAESYANIGACLIEQEQYTEALKYLFIADTLYKVINEQENMLIVYFNIGHVYLEMKRPKDALQWLQKGLNLAKEIGDADNPNLADFYKDLAQTNEMTGNYKAAYENYRLYKICNDSLFNEENTMKATQAEMQYEFDKKEEKEQAAFNLSMAHQRSARRQWIMRLSSLAAGLLLAIGFIYWRYRVKQKTTQQLLLKNQKIETLIKELHHRVKNNMQLIGSLLSLQSEKIENAGARDAFNEGINRVHAMGLIHQGLYLNEDVTSVNMEQYILSLIDNLTGAYCYGQRITVHKSIAAVFLDIESAVPLGLILNELLTNALKYGMNNDFPLLCVVYNRSRLSVQDNGTTPMNEEMYNNSDSFGLKLVHILARQINAIVHIKSEEGTNVSIVLGN